MIQKCFEFLFDVVVAHGTLRPFTCMWRAGCQRAFFGDVEALVFLDDRIAWGFDFGSDWCFQVIVDHSVRRLEAVIIVRIREVFRSRQEWCGFLSAIAAEMFLTGSRKPSR